MGPENLKNMPENDEVAANEARRLGAGALKALSLEEREQYAKDYAARATENAVEEIAEHAKEACSVERSFAKQIEKDQGRVPYGEFEKWEDEFTYEWDRIEKLTSDANLDIRTQAEGKQYIRAYFKEEELGQTIEAYAGNFYHRRNRALLEAIENSDDPAKEADLEVVYGFPATVSRHLDFKYPQEDTLRKDPAIFESARTRAHNDTIRHLNELNDLAKKYKVRPFTVRNFWTSDIQNQTPAIASLLRYDRDIVEEYYYQAFSDEEDKRRTEMERLQRYGIFR